MANGTAKEKSKMDDEADEEEATGKCVSTAAFRRVYINSRLRYTLIYFRNYEFMS